jgi:hypothetical protein
MHGFRRLQANDQRSRVCRRDEEERRKHQAPTPPSALYCATAHKAGTVSSDILTHMLVPTIQEKSEPSTQYRSPYVYNGFLQSDWLLRDKQHKPGSA